MPRISVLALVLLALSALSLSGQETATPFDQYMLQQAPPAPVDSPSLLSQPARAAGPQALSADEAWSWAKERAMGVVRGCDYTEYIRLAEQVKSGWEMYSDWNSEQQVRRWAVPFMDMVSMFLRGGGTMAAQKSAEIEGEGLIYQLEQLCNAVAIADDANRQYQIIKAGRFNIDGALDWLIDWADQDDGRSPTPGGDRAHALETWAETYENAVPAVGGKQDSLWRAVNGTLRETLAASEDMHLALEAVFEDINEIREEMILTAEMDGEGEFVCPEGYPDPNRSDVEYHDGIPVCGPVGPERSTQLLAQIELVKTQLRALQMAADARGLEVDAVRLMADNYQRRMNHSTTVMSTVGQ